MIFNFSDFVYFQCFVRVVYLSKFTEYNEQYRYIELFAREEICIVWEFQSTAKPIRMNKITKKGIIHKVKQNNSKSLNSI